MSKVKIERWTEHKAEEELKRRFKEAMVYRRTIFEPEWKRLESYLFQVQPSMQESFSFESQAEILHYLKAQSEEKSIHIPQVIKNLRFLHSQMSANPPSAIFGPENPDEKCRRSALAAQALGEWGRTEYLFQERQDQASLSTLGYGTGITRHWFDKLKGRVISYDAETGEAEAEGDNATKNIPVWHFWANRSATSIDEIEETWEEVRMPLSKAKQLFPDKVALLEDAVMRPGANNADEWGILGGEDLIRDIVDVSGDDKLKEQEVRILEYHQKGSIFNGGIGYHCFHLENGKLLTELAENPTPDHEIPYAIMTDIDLPGQWYGRSTVYFALPLARVVDDLDSMIFDNISAHGNQKLIVYDGSEINDSDLNTDPIEIIRVKGTAQQAPTILSPPSLSIDIYKLRENILRAIDDIMGINEVVQGNFKKDMSGFSAQTAINAANLVRRRLFNKYTAYVKKLNDLMIFNIRDNWKEKRKISITGKAGVNFVKKFSGDDIKEGWQLKVTYGESFSLDPATRREEIMQSKDLLKEAGVSPVKIAQSIKFNEVGQLFDATEIAKQRQLDIFYRMKEIYDDTGKAVNIPADQMRKADHAGMATAAMEYFMTEEFLQLDEELKTAMYDHADDREKLAALQAAKPGTPTTLEEAEKMFPPEGAAPAGQPGAPAAAPAPGAPPGMPPIGAEAMPAEAGAPPADMSAVIDAGVVV